MRTAHCSVGACRSWTRRTASGGRPGSTRAGRICDLVGVEVDGRIAFQRKATVGGVAVVQRMVWLDVTPDAFRWQWQRSSDGGAVWDVAWEIDYRRA